MNLREAQRRGQLLGGPETYKTEMAKSKRKVGRMIAECEVMMRYAHHNGYRDLGKAAYRALHGLTEVSDELAYIAELTPTEHLDLYPAPGESAS